MLCVPKGDSGGGLVQSGASESEGRQIIGIVSMGAKKCGVRAGIYTRVNKSGLFSCTSKTFALVTNASTVH